METSKEGQLINLRILDAINNFNKGNDKILSLLNEIRLGINNNSQSIKDLSQSVSDLSHSVTGLSETSLQQNRITLKAISDSNSLILNALELLIKKNGSSKTLSLQKNNTESNDDNSTNSKNNLIKKEKDSSSGGNDIKLSLNMPKKPKIKKKNDISSQFARFNQFSKANQKEEKRNKSIAYRAQKNNK